MREVKIILTREQFDRYHLHYDIDLDDYILFINTKKYNRRLKEIMSKTKK